MVINSGRGTTVGTSVWTVTGRVAAHDLGLVLPHEHLLADFDTPADTPAGWAAIGRDYPGGDEQRRRYEAPLAIELLGEISLGAPNRANWHLDDRAALVRDLSAFAEHGGRTIVDLTTDANGRDPAALRAIATETGLNIVMGCGWYHPAWLDGRAGAPRDVATATEHLVRELTDGVDGIRPGVIGEIAALDPADDAARVILVAAAQASARTGAPIWIGRHPDAGITADTLELLADSGADPARVAVGGCNPLSPDPDALLPLLERGVYVAFDRLGRLPSVYSVNDDQDVASAVGVLARNGHAERVLLSHAISAKSELISYGGTGYAFLSQQFMPFVGRFGLDEQLIHDITVDNPRRWLSGAHGGGEQ